MVGGPSTSKPRLRLWSRGISPPPPAPVSARGRRMSLSPLSTRETPPSVPRPVSPAHLLCISLLPCRKKHNSFVVYPSQSGSESGGMFPVSCGSQTERTRGHVATHVFFYAKSVMTWRREKNTSPPCLSLSSTDTCRLRAVTHPPASVVIHGSHRQERSALGGSD